MEQEKQEEKKIETETVPCPIGTKSHAKHDRKIIELTEFAENVGRTPRMLAERIKVLEAAIQKQQRIILNYQEALKRVKNHLPKVKIQ